MHHPEHIKLLEQQGWDTTNQGNYDAAITIWDEVFRHDPQNIAAFQGKIACLRKKHEFREAKSLLETALKQHPRHIGILSEAGWLNLEQKQYDAAIEAFDKVLEIDPKNEGILLWKIQLLREKRRFDEAQTLIVESGRLFPQSLRILTAEGWLRFYERQYSEAIEIFEKIESADKDNESAIQGNIASLRALGRYTDGIKLAQAGLGRLGRSPGISSELGWINFQQGKYDEAERDFQNVLDANPEDAYSYVNLAWSLVRQNTDSGLDRATTLCREALAKSPYLAEAYGCLGNIAFKKGHIREAEAFFISSIKADSAKGHYADLGALYSQMGQYDAAKIQLSRAVTNNPDDAYAHVELGNLNVLTDRVKEGIREFRLATIIDPQNPNAANGLAIALMENLQLIEAEKILRNAIRSMDRNKRWELHLTLCRLLTIIGDDTGDVHFYEEALKEVNTAIQLKPGHPSPYFHSGIVRFKMEDYSNSLKSFKNCLKEDEFHLEAALNARRVRALIRKERAISKGSRAASLFLVILFLGQLTAIWVFRIFYGNRISETLVGILVPILSGLIVVSVLLPWLNRLKLTGLEAQLNEQNPKETLNKGPKGEIGFSKTATS